LQECILGAELCVWICLLLWMLPLGAECKNWVLIDELLGGYCNSPRKGWLDSGGDEALERWRSEAALKVQELITQHNLVDLRSEKEGDVSIFNEFLEHF
jgi:hypothetical protein